MKKLLTSICMQKIILHVLRFPWDIAKIYARQKCYYHFVEKILFICGQNINFTICIFLEILQRYGNFLFWVLWHAWLQTHKMIVSTCRGLKCLSACQKKTASFISYFRYYALKNPAIWLAESILVHNSRTRTLPDMVLVVKYD